MHMSGSWDIVEDRTIIVIRVFVKFPGTPVILMAVLIVITNLHQT